MARGLAIETSGRVGSVAVVEGGVVVAEEAFEHGLKHAAELVPTMDRLCRGRGWGPGEVEEVYVSVGPGSFTGLRIGVTVAKTMALATGVKVVAVPTVRVLVENAPGEARDAIVVLDAKKDQVYTARFQRVEGRWEEREGAHLDTLTGMLGRAPRPVYLVGEGVPFHEKFLVGTEGVVVTAPEAWRARAGVVARIGVEMAGRGEFVDPWKLTPVYVRRPEAEEKWEEMRGRGAGAG